jgi:murein DD-endopeptidase MepM/ murein hydrolase activator NlpD
VAFVIFSVGPVTHARLRTVDALPLLTGASLALVLLMVASYAVGFHSAHGAFEADATDRPAVRLDPDRPEIRALIDRLGALSSRLTLLESEAATLARRLGVSRTPDARPAPLTQSPGSAAKAHGPGTAEDAKASARGGPYIPLGDDASRTAAPDSGRGDLGTGLSRLEDDLDQVEATVEWLADLAVPRDVASMAFPNRRPILAGPTSSGFGSRRDPFTGRLARHEGLDFPAPTGTPILASAGGRVIAAGSSGAYGNAVVIDHGNGLETLYGHASRIFVHAGDLVMPQQVIAAVGSTGRSTGSHLHFEVIRRGVRVEPRDYLAHSDASAALP